MFGALRLGYATFFAITAIAFLASLTLGRQPLSSYIFSFTGWRVLIWSLPLLLWLG